MERSPIDLFHDALDAADVTYHERERGIVDSCSEELVKALLAAGWKPPTPTEVTADAVPTTRPELPDGYRPGCSNWRCSCWQPREVCDEFMGAGPGRYCPRCGWAHELHQR